MALPDVAAVLAMAPDASAARAGQGLATTRQWTSLGRNDEALWGLCQGSGKLPYQTRVSLADLATSCTCPSRKFPCKHALGLLILAAQGEVGVTDTIPDFVAEWFEKREARAEKKARAATVELTPEAIAKAAAQAERRSEQRQARMEEGLADLDRWMQDLVRSGLGNAPVADATFWSTRAKRLVDAQLPGLAYRIARCHEHASTRPDWPTAVLRELGLVTLAIEAHARRDRLDPLERAGLDSVLGVPRDKDDAEECIEDDWLCLGTRGELEEHLTIQRAWFAGERSQRYALVVAVGPVHLPLAPVGVPGRTERMTLRFFPAALPLRALIDARGQPAPQRGCAAQSIADALERHCDALARDPWLDTWPMEIAAALVRDEHGGFWLRDADGNALPLASNDREAWSWYAASLGEIGRFAVEWDGERARLMHGWKA